MKKDGTLFDDFSKLMSSASGAMMDMKREVESIVHAQMDNWLDKMNLVTREEFDAVKAMAEKARLENDALAKRLDALEKTKKPIKKVPATKSSTTKRSTKKS